jgi:hypothetical protein
MANPAQPNRQVDNQQPIAAHQRLTPLGVALSSLCKGGFTALAAHSFTVFNSVGGFFFGAARSLSNTAIDWMYDKANLQTDTPCSKTVKWALGFFGSTALAALAATAIGYPITFGAAIILSIVTDIMAIGGAICLSLVIFSVVATVAIVKRMKRDHCTVGEAARTLFNELDQIAKQIRIGENGLIRWTN